MQTKVEQTKCRTSGWQEIPRIKYEITCQHFNSMVFLCVFEWGRNGPIVCSLTRHSEAHTHTHTEKKAVDKKDKRHCRCWTQHGMHASSNTSGEQWKIICFSRSGVIIINQSYFFCILIKNEFGPNQQKTIASSKWQNDLPNIFGNWPMRMICWSLVFIGIRSVWFTVTFNTRSTLNF